jgi:hypothetical protein
MRQSMSEFAWAPVVHWSRLSALDPPDGAPPPPASPLTSNPVSCDTMYSTTIRATPPPPPAIMPVRPRLLALPEEMSALSLNVMLARYR